MNKRKEFTLNKKLLKLKQTYSEKKQAATEKEVGIAPTTLPTAIKYREKIMKTYERSSLCPDRERLRSGGQQAAEVALNTLFKNVLAADIPVKGTALQEKAC